MSLSPSPVRGLAGIRSLILVLALAAVPAVASAAAPSAPPDRARADTVAEPSAPTSAGEPDVEDVEGLKRAIAALEEEVSRLKEAGPGEDEKIRELERRIDLLAVEIERLRTGGAVEETTLEGRKGLGPAASTVYGKDRGVAIGGYGEALYTNHAELRQDEEPSSAIDEFDFLRAVFYVGYKFSDSILFNSEIEVEHASTDEGGSVSVEFAYLEFQKRPEIGLRAGMLLVPVGFVNELHEPPVFHGARRPEVELAILPTTWRENGAGLFGAAGPFEYRAYGVVGLRSSGFTAAGIRGGGRRDRRAGPRTSPSPGGSTSSAFPGCSSGARSTPATRARARPWTTAGSGGASTSSTSTASTSAKACSSGPSGRAAPSTTCP